MSEKNTILIADDKEVNRECLTRLLEDDYIFFKQVMGMRHWKFLIKKRKRFLQLYSI